MDTDKLEEKLIFTVKLAVNFIDTVLIKRNDTNKEILEDYKSILLEYLDSSDKSALYKLREISSRPSKEGSATDYTEGMSLQMKGEYFSLRDLIIRIEELL